jgi:hypothetical protein
MTTVTKAKVNPKHEKEILHEAVSNLKKFMEDYKKERKADWKLFKDKFNADMTYLKKSIKGLSPGKKK